MEPERFKTKIKIKVSYWWVWKTSGGKASFHITFWGINKGFWYFIAKYYTPLFLPWNGSFCVMMMSPLSYTITLCLFHQVAELLDYLLFADSHHDFLLPGLVVWRVWLSPECHPNDTRLRLKHRRHLPHGVSVCSSLPGEGGNSEGSRWPWWSSGLSTAFHWCVGWFYFCQFGKFHQE